MRRRDHALGFLLDCFSIGKGEFLPNPRNVNLSNSAHPSCPEFEFLAIESRLNPNKTSRPYALRELPAITPAARNATREASGALAARQTSVRRTPQTQARAFESVFCVSRILHFTNVLVLIRLRLRVGVGQSCSWSTSGAETSTNSKSKSKSKSIDLSRGKICCAFGVLTSIVADWRTWKLLGQPAAARSGFDSNRLRFQSASIPIADRPVRRAVAASGAWEYEYADLFASTCPSTAPSNGS